MFRVILTLLTSIKNPGKIKTILFSILLILITIPNLNGQENEVESSNIATSKIVASILSAPTDVSAKDTDNDKGQSITINWTLSADDKDGGAVSGYKIYRAVEGSNEFVEVGNESEGTTKSTDNKTTDGVSYIYRVDSYQILLDSVGNKSFVTSASVASSPVKSSAQWFNFNRGYCLIFVLFVSGAIIYYIRKASAGGEIYVRKLGGIDAVDEAVGRATEMGKKVFFIPGIQDMNNVQTIAGIAILGRVAQKAAEYGTWLEVPVSKSLVMVTARETMKEAYTAVGRPDAFNEAQVHFLTDDQFGYAAAIDGMVVREKPATIFYMGAFFAESLILAETGNAAGAIQIAGTAMPSQLPFFVAACDYTLIGEELFAASAYLSGEPRQLGSLKGQDIGKALFLVAIIVGIIMESFGWTIGGHNLSAIFKVN